MNRSVKMFGLLLISVIIGFIGLYVTFQLLRISVIVSGIFSIILVIFGFAMKGIYTTIKELE